ncbi:hypothetical protein BC939DRAFT_61810 [Gamsiella multidivaricata]|uniref:uncharacterized protein n=1 Tax=Gamsiella multidivaricata TaxID=101098 RepID=UPI00221E53FA|nr:uncharacterized protein BC939DRAFT_61810 [Gamsiella multidivaricata]KAI7828627.1 hypothetical protein BC939DRAFT_61810 [Gamsiella multidivaricata]
MADSTQQPDYYLHLDLAGAEMEPQPHTDGGETFLDFSESGHENSHQDISDQDTSQWQSEEVKDTMSATISVDSTALDNNSTPVSFNNLIEAQVSIDTGAVHWNGAHQAYGSLMDMELGKISPQEQITGCITPDLIFPAGSLSSAAPPTEDIGAKQGSDISEATSLPNIPSPAITIPSTLEKSASPVIPQAAAALVAVTPPKDIRRSTRARRQSSLAAQSEEYLQNAQGVSIVVPSAPAERVTRSKKVYCYCQKPDDGEVMIQCDNCRQWFHGACVDVTDEIAELMELKNEKFFCDPCTEKLKGKELWSINALRSDVCPSSLFGSVCHFLVT